MVTGIHTISPRNVASMAKRGFEMLTPATDTILLDVAARDVLAQTRQVLGRA